MELAVIGSGDFILGFRLAGVEKTYAADSSEKIIESVTRVLKDEDVGILILKGSDMEQLPVRLRNTLEESVKPTVITMGAEEGGISMRDRIIRAMGVDLW